MVVLIGVAMLTIVLSWTVLNMVFTLRYADQHRGLGRAGIDFNDSNAEEPHVPRLRPRRLHHRHVLLGGFAAWRSPTPAVVRVRCGDRRWLGQSHLPADSLDLCGAQGCAYSSTEAGF
jgi:hypothetical protein